MSFSNKNHRNMIPSPETLATLPPDGGSAYNRLIFEKSPYLLQHAANPVDWYPWGEFAFRQAEKEDKPIFLSIGYATCHWCHVMEHESFEDPEVAAHLNKTFLCIKVDREERPDIDRIYMAACQAMTGSGGWPLTIMMTADKRPFFCGTYFPKHSRLQRVGLMDLIEKTAELWQRLRPNLLKNADQLVHFLQKNTIVQTKKDLLPAIVDTAFAQLNEQFDPVYGGFGSTPKFPTPHHLTFLLRYWHDSGNPQALEMVQKTLRQMRLGGIYDHVGFGFHRYATDARWKLPHFEKMLYDQALLTIACIETFQATGNETHALTAREILTYVLRDMTAPEGGFYSAEDADSEGEEGRFYLWTPEELRSILGREDGERFIRLFNVKADGNFADEATGETTGRSILFLEKSLKALARDMNLSEDELLNQWETARQKLFAVREQRHHPLKDDKILTDWNGLMIAALAKAAAALDEPQYARTACKAADFIIQALRDHDGRLLKRFCRGEAGLPAHLDDYAFMVWGLLELYEAVFEVKYLQQAIELNEQMLTYFRDDQNGGFFFSAHDQHELPVRHKEIYDGALPSGNSVAAMNLLRLARITGRPAYEEEAMAIGRAFSAQVNEIPMGHTALMSALHSGFGRSCEVVIAGRTNAADTQAMLKAVQQAFLPDTVVVFRPVDIDRPPIIEIAEFTATRTALNGKATAYVCRNNACQAPATDIDEMFKLLKDFKK
jgi:hypothetical protein